MSGAKIELGRHLFYDVRLSGNGQQSCATCDQQTRAFTDGRAQSVGSTAQIHPRSSMSLVNVAYAEVLTWADPSMRRLEDQALVPMYGEHPVEMGLSRSHAWLDTLRRDNVYTKLFSSAYPGSSDPFTRGNGTVSRHWSRQSQQKCCYSWVHFDRGTADGSHRLSRVTHRRGTLARSAFRRPLAEPSRGPASRAIGSVTK
jgi:hypothetical protein